MEINEKVLKELANQMGMGANGDNSNNKINKAMEMADMMKGKNSEELMEEIVRFKSKMQSNPEQLKKQIKTIKSLSVMMNDEQKAQLNKVIKMLEA